MPWMMVTQPRRSLGFSTVRYLSDSNVLERKLFFDTGKVNGFLTLYKAWLISVNFIDMGTLNLMFNVR